MPFLEEMHRQCPYYSVVLLDCMPAGKVEDSVAKADLHTCVFCFEQLDVRFHLTGYLDAHSSANKLACDFYKNITKKTSL